MIKLAGVDVAGPPSSGIHLGCRSNTYLSSLYRVYMRERERERERVLLLYIKGNDLKRATSTAFFSTSRALSLVQLGSS